MAGVRWLALVMLYVGLALAWVATIMYVRRGALELRTLRNPRKVSSSA
jgi:hypothetical protein